MMTKLTKKSERYLIISLETEASQFHLRHFRFIQFVPGSRKKSEVRCAPKILDRTMDWTG